MKRMQDLPTELGRTMRKWRMGQGDGWTVERAAAEIDVSKSTWSELENGKRRISLETAKRLSRKTGVSIEELSLQGGQPMRQSQDDQERLQRAAAASSVIPGLGLLMGLFPELSADDADLLLSSAESLVNRRRQRKERE